MPADVASWFAAAAGGTATIEEQTDLYLWLPEAENLGVKLRDGGQRLEFKSRERELGTVECPGEVFGLVEQWQKWSCPTSSRDGLGLPPDVWLEVVKSRRLIQVDGPGDWHCQIELTDLVLADDRWWTFGFEAPGSGEAAGQSLRRTATEVFKRAEVPVDLDWDDSKAYPAWLAGLLSK